MTYFEPPEPDYTAYSNRKLLILPLALLFVSLLVIIGWTVVTGYPVDRGMVFTGGSEVRIGVDDTVDDPRAEIESIYGDNAESITSVAGSNDYIVQFPEGELTTDEIENPIQETDGLQVEQLSQISPSLGSEAQTTALYGLLAAFALMSIFVTLVFRNAIPALIVMVSVVVNLSVTISAMNILGISLTMGTVGALLMLIGYSVDSDILLNKRVLKQDKVDFVPKVHDAMRTGITMNVTSMSAMVVMFILATLFRIDLLADMGIVLAVGLFSDLIVTYLLNVTILRIYTQEGDIL